MIDDEVGEISVLMLLFLLPRFFRFLLLFVGFDGFILRKVDFISCLLYRRFSGRILRFLLE